jgi:hypothetical protein
VRPAGIGAKNFNPLHDKFKPVVFDAAGDS